VSFEISLKLLEHFSRNGERLLVKTRMRYGIIAFLSVTLLGLSIANGSLSVSVTVGRPEIYQGESQLLTVKTNEGGMGILLVTQPNEGASCMDFLEDHQSLEELWNLLPLSTRAEVAGRLGQRIASFIVIRIDTGGGNMTATFPEDFTGINGEPSTETVGEYKAILAFLSSQEADCRAECRCHLFEIDFDCVSWPVIPEYPSASLFLILFAAVTLSMIGQRRKLRV